MFYGESAVPLKAEDWIKSHPYLESFRDEDERGWLQT
jgi:hypothetical protein